MVILSWTASFRAGPSPGEEPRYQLNDASHPARWAWVSLLTRCPSTLSVPPPPLFTMKVQHESDCYHIMEDYGMRSAASILASVKEQEARFERLTRALEEERRNVSLQLERSSHLPADVLGNSGNTSGSQPLPWQQVVMQVNEASRIQHLTSTLPIPSQSECAVSLSVGLPTRPVAYFILPRLAIPRHHLHKPTPSSLCFWVMCSPGSTIGITACMLGLDISG